MGEYFEGKFTQADFQGGVSKTTMVITDFQGGLKDNYGYYKL